MRIELLKVARMCTLSSCCENIFCKHFIPTTREYFSLFQKSFALNTAKVSMASRIVNFTQSGIRLCAEIDSREEHEKTKKKKGGKKPQVSIDFLKVCSNPLYQRLETRPGSLFYVCMLQGCVCCLHAPRLCVLFACLKKQKTKQNKSPLHSKNRRVQKGGGGGGGAATGY